VSTRWYQAPSRGAPLVEVTHRPASYHYARPTPEGIARAAADLGVPEAEVRAMLGLDLDDQETAT
jgi:hypothetical protein